MSFINQLGPAIHRPRLHESSLDGRVFRYLEALNLPDGIAKKLLLLVRNHDADALLGFEHLRTLLAAYCLSDVQLQQPSATDEALISFRLYQWLESSPDHCAGAIGVVTTLLDVPEINRRSMAPAGWST